MPDVFTKAKRSAVMARIRSHGNRDTELVMIQRFRLLGITGWRRHQPVFGKPDFVFRARKIAVFVDGCFWHGCPKHCRLPTGNAAFWRKKFQRNRQRDLLVNRSLRKSGWHVVRIWEHELAKKNLRRLGRRLERVRENSNFKIQTSRKNQNPNIKKRKKAAAINKNEAV